MDTFSKIAAILFAVVILWWLFRFLKSNPDSLSKENIGKSAYTMGLLGIGLIVFIGIIVMLLRR